MTHPLVSHVRSALFRLADSATAAEMQAYMRTDQPFYGVKSKPRGAVFAQAKREFPIKTATEYRRVIFTLWRGTYREEMYLALDVAEGFRAFRSLESWPTYVELVHTAPWWDTLDWIAGKIVGPLVLQHRELEAYLVVWRESPSMWVRRASLLAHLKHKVQTNRDLLAETILLLASEEEFFIRKAIGWVLREYAKSNPFWVSEFVAGHADELSSLSRREALKHIG